MSNKEQRSELKDKVYALPTSPGVYQYFDEGGKIIYIGKAKNLKKRVSSYFTKNHDSIKTRILVKNIVDVKHIVVDSEEDALLLENNLIKKYKPRYNVLLKDDKSYSWICIKNEPFSRVQLTYRLQRDGSTYFGPYANRGVAKTLVDLISQLYPLRNCSLALNEEGIRLGYFKVCLEYHLKNCLGPCEGHQTESNYNDNIAQIKRILKGDLQEVIEFLEMEMSEHAEKYEFEQAEEIRKKIVLLENYKSKSTIVNPKINNIDVYSFQEDEKNAYVNYMRVVNGAIIQSHTTEVRKRLDESKEYLLQMAITEIRSMVSGGSREILVPFDPQFELQNVQFMIPQKGDKKKLLDLSDRNVKYYRLEKEKRLSLRNPEMKTDRLMNTMQKDLRMKIQPRHIECFDNSNIQGHYPVASCVVFINGKPAKREYRHFNIKTVEGPNDFASMEEIVYRRYKRLKEEEKPLPQLIVIDGGKGQLGAAINALSKLDLMSKIGIIGIAKRLEEIFFPGDPIPLYLDKNTETLRIIQHLRDEAHRFGITFHRQKRSKGFIVSELDNIKGVGPKTKEELFKYFGTIEGVRKASIDQLSEIVGKSKATLVHNYFNA